MQLYDVITPPKSAGAYGALLDLLLSDPVVAAWLEPDDDSHESDIAHDESPGIRVAKVVPSGA
jgi:hypothetical protein